VFRENPPDLAPGYGEGTVQETGGLETCVTGPSDSNLAILLISDVLGKSPSRIFFFFFNLLISIMARARFGFEITYNLIDVGF
jgi:hypothetical protein